DLVQGLPQGDLLLRSQLIEALEIDGYLTPGPLKRSERTTFATRAFRRAARRAALQLLLDALLDARATPLLLERGLDNGRHLLICQILGVGLVTVGIVQAAMERDQIQGAAEVQAPHFLGRGFAVSRVGSNRNEDSLVHGVADARGGVREPQKTQYPVNFISGERCELVGGMEIASDIAQP